MPVNTFAGRSHLICESTESAFEAAFQAGCREFESRFPLLTHRKPLPKWLHWKQAGKASEENVLKSRSVRTCLRNR
jgi:hypothetical protein